MTRPSKRYQVVGIGNAIVDIISPAEDRFLERMKIRKGIMQLIERDRAEFLYARMEDRQRSPGGAVANTLAGLGNLGLATAFIGRVRDDALGRFYVSALRAQGTDFPNAPTANTPIAGTAPPTSRSMIFVSPNGERSMNTYLGISAEVGPEDVPPQVAEQAEILFLEGYLYDKPKGKAAFEQAARLCRQAGGRTGIALSDPFCVDRHRVDFHRLLGTMDYAIGNEHEWMSLYQTEDLGGALAQAARQTEVIVCTRSEQDVIVMQGAERVRVPVRVIPPVDATGAGDQFAAGFLYGLAQRRDLLTAGRMGCVAAGEVISHFGARPQQDLKAMFAEQGLL